jgi:hypothetical protein
MPTDKLTPAMVDALRRIVESDAEQGIACAHVPHTLGSTVTISTMRALDRRGLVLENRGHYSITEAGRAALAQAGHTGNAT